MKAKRFHFILWFGIFLILVLGTYLWITFDRTGSLSDEDKIKQSIQLDKERKAKVEKELSKGTKHKNYGELVEKTNSEKDNSLAVLPDTMFEFSEFGSKKGFDTLKFSTVKFGGKDSYYQGDNLNKEVYLGSRNIPIKYLSEFKEPSKMDSVLEKITEINLKSQPESIEIEFWNNPIEYKGYYLGKSKLALYGAQKDDNIEIFRDSTSYYLKIESYFYQIFPSNEFKYLKELEDEDLLKKLKISEN